MLFHFCLQSSELPATTDNLQLASDVDVRSALSTELESGTGEKLLFDKTTQQTTLISQETKHLVTATSKHPGQTSTASGGDSTLPKRDSQISAESGQKIRSLAGTDVTLQCESVHRRSSLSACDRSPRSCSRTSRSVTTTHDGRSSSSQRDRSALQGRSSYRSRQSFFSRGEQQGCRDNASERYDKRSLESFRYPESVSKGRSHSGEVQRSGRRDGRVSYRERELELKKYESCGSRRERRERGSSSRDEVDRRKAEDSGRETQVAEDLDRLSMDVSGSSKVEDEVESEYQAVLTRHVNQLFVRGDNVALVAILG